MYGVFCCGAKIRQEAVCLLTRAGLRKKGAQTTVRVPQPHAAKKQPRMSILIYASIFGAAIRVSINALMLLQSTIHYYFLIAIL
ncbi:hypothetical protein T231_11900 [Tannerella sp. oral taxon BU063 isolate Cell 6/7/9]|uniref:Uncharacterized protein n=2 Tax=Tannerella serpentiformis TaxID=712710 RepID=W2CNN1_9BACT|nr:hypothetical protein T231_11900 [Tannerella sp. oral taxon BU063 isolate Cell 6/7/9]ETK13067.1 hypothetical protein T235_05565 [Tannerella sp. oral taxon BU063 isolate Cell 8/11]